MSLDLETDLHLLAEQIELGDGDRLVADVMRRISIGAEPVSLVSRTRGARRFTLAGLSLAAGVLAVVLVVPDSRQAVADWFGIGSTRIERPTPTVAPETTVPSPIEPSVPSPTETSSPIVTAEVATSTTTVARFPDELGFGEPVSDEDARAQTGLAVPRSVRLGSAVATFVTRPPAAGQIVVVYPPSDLLPVTPVAGVGALLSAASGEVSEGLFLKVAAPGTTVATIEILVSSGATVPAIWLGGDPHQYAFEAADGTVVFDTLRLATNTLLWTDGGVVYRFESSLTQAEAVAVAATVTVG